MKVWWKAPNIARGVGICWYWYTGGEEISELAVHVVICTVFTYCRGAFRVNRTCGGVEFQS